MELETSEEISDGDEAVPQACPYPYEHCEPDDDGTTTPPPLKDYYCVYPEIRYSRITDSHEGYANGPNAYMYFEGIGYPGDDSDVSGSSPKAGKLPDYLGTGFAPSFGQPSMKKVDYDNDVFASNFQGPRAVAGSRTQREFYGSSGNGALSRRVYPLVTFAYCTSVPAGDPAPAIGWRKQEVWEDDECFYDSVTSGYVCNDDDYVGSFYLDRGTCKSEVWDTGARMGWTASSLTPYTYGSIAEVASRNWCFKCENATSCPFNASNGVGPLRDYN